jgi:hypothetical protein
VVERFDHKIHSAYGPDFDERNHTVGSRNGRRRYRYDKSKQRLPRYSDEEDSEHDDDLVETEDDENEDAGRESQISPSSARFDPSQRPEAYIKSVSDIIELTEELKDRDAVVARQRAHVDQKLSMRGPGSGRQRKTPNIRDSNDDGGQFIFARDGSVYKSNNNLSEMGDVAATENGVDGLIAKEVPGGGSRFDMEELGPYNHTSSLICVRRLRIITVALEVTDNVERMCKSADTATMCTLLLRQALKNDSSTNFSSTIREQLEHAGSSGTKAGLHRGPPQVCDAETPIAGRYSSDDTLCDDRWSSPLLGSTSVPLTGPRNQLTSLVRPTKMDYCFRRQSEGIRYMCDWCVSIVLAAAQRKLATQLRTFAARSDGTSISLDVDSLILQVGLFSKLLT